MLCGFQLVAFPISAMLAPLPRLSSAMTFADLVFGLGVVILGLQRGAGQSSASTDPSRGTLLERGGVSL